MSAFMCSNLHLSILAVYAVRHDLDRCPEDGMLTRKREERLFHLLARENLASLDARYPRDSHLDHDQEAELVASLERHMPVSAIQVVKLCHCYAYQACEHRAWQDSEARKIVDDIEAHAVRRLPGYEEAKWSV